MTLLYLILCAATFYSAFCRLVHTDKLTDRKVRLAFCVVGAVSALSIFGVLVWGHKPVLLEVLNQLAFSIVLLVSSKRWASGVPDEYQTRPADSL